MQWLVALLLAGAVTNPSQMTFSHDSTQSSRRAISSKLSDIVSVKDAPFNAKADGSNDDSAAINAAGARAQNTIYLPASSSCYNIGATTIVVPGGVFLRGDGMGGPGQGATCITYTGTGCAILYESVQHSGAMGIDIQVNSASSTAAGVCLKSTNSVTEFITLRSLSIRATGTARVTGQIGLWFDDVSNGVFWNSAGDIVFQGWDTALLLQGGAVQGANDNTFVNLMSYGHNTAFRLISTGFVNDNDFHGLKCSRSDGTMVGTQSCLLVADDGSASFGNRFYSVVADQGTPAVCATFGTNARANKLEVNCESGGPVTDNNTTAFPNTIMDAVQGTSVIHSIKGAAVSGGASDLLLAGGAKVATFDGTVVLGTPAQTLKAGVRVASSTMTSFKPFAATDCAGATLSPTTSSLLQASIFTCGTVQTFNIPAIQGANGIVQNLPKATVGDIFTFQIVSTAAANFTVAISTGGTLVGNTAVNNSSRIVLCRVTSIGSGTETMTCYL